MKAAKSIVNIINVGILFQHTHKHTGTDIARVQMKPIKTHSTVRQRDKHRPKEQRSRNYQK